MSYIRASFFDIDFVPRSRHGMNVARLHDDGYGNTFVSSYTNRTGRATRRLLKKNSRTCRASLFRTSCSSCRSLRGDETVSKSIDVVLVPRNASNRVSKSRRWILHTIMSWMC